MTRQVVIAKGALRLNKADVALLNYLYGKTNMAGDGVCVSLREMEEATSIPRESGALRRCVIRLDTSGLVEVEPVFAEDGGQRANRYRLTSAGLLAAASLQAGAGQTVTGEVVGAEGNWDNIRTSALRMGVLLDNPDYVLGDDECDLIGEVSAPEREPEALASEEDECNPIDGVPEHEPEAPVPEEDERDLIGEVLVPEREPDMTVFDGRECDLIGGAPEREPDAAV